ncbi:NAD(P)/FAD-dependent oxidoreductase [Bradyrhizobium cenepequi]|uniref:NAD(P)/FAD-dependent oxidoreductase n=1 Tax=Bradyrhizobium cenepequi TaxID=2821403 RepID=UPI001CE25AE4|nr:NAD(P)/FAD-dependent oxidoreductase [Bradyrhizobium cenepequi]MCA6105708.1 NAD(P)/FAD-dependent oxidoreductase [Bradyrhizobium cenepequi]
MARVIVLGAGFAGLWAAIGAARKLDEIGQAAEVEILVIDRNPYHNIRVRNYEVDLSEAAIPLAELLDPIGVAHRVAEVEAIDPVKQQVTIATSDSREVLTYERLVLALGSELTRPAIPGLAANGFDVDTYAAAVRLDKHLAALGAQAPSEGRSTVVVVGAGFTGIEVATEMPGKLDRAGVTGDRRIILVDPNPEVGVTIGDNARPVINEALSALGVETRLDVKVTALDANAITLSSGETVPTQTIVWCAGMRASPLAETLDVERDRHGRVIVDQFMRAAGATNVFAAGDMACSFVDGVHASVMSCQFARPMGRFAGHNVVADLLGRPMLPLHIDWYVTVLDLGAWGALYTEGWDRQVHTSGAAAKLTKQTINHVRIYPPRTGSRAEILAAAAPTLQAPPAVRP